MRKRVYGPANQVGKRKPRSRYTYAFRRKSPSYSLPVKNSPFNLVSGSTPQKAKLFTKFIYSETGLNLDPGIGGTTGVRVFDLNSLFDPDVTGSGHQPAGFDQMMAVYEEYLVYGVRYKISFYGTDTGNEYIGGVTITDQISTVSDPRVYIENGMTQWGLVCAKAAGAGERIKEFSGYVDLSKVHGESWASYSEQYSYKGNASASPPDRAYLHCWVAPANASSDLSASVWCVELEYHCILSGGKLNALS